MNHRPGTSVPTTGIYWCTVCKIPRQFTAGDEFPTCNNLCGRGHWELVEEPKEKNPARG